MLTPQTKRDATRRSASDDGRRHPWRQRLIVVVAVVAVAAVGVVVAAKGLHRGPPGGRLGTARSPHPATSIDMWTKCGEVARLTDAELDHWRSVGVGGFVCGVQWLGGLGGDQAFSDVNGSLADPAHSLERSLRDSKIAERASTRGIKLYLAFNLNNHSNPGTPLADWFNDKAWANDVAPTIAGAALAAKQLGFAGVGFDEELYAPAQGVAAQSWDFRYRGNAHDEATTRAKVADRGRQLMKAVVAAFPGLEIIDYGTQFPETW